MIDFMQNNDHTCLICGQHIDTADLRINQVNGDNVIRFAICEGCMQQMAIELYQFLPQELKQNLWIPVSERLPDKNGCYLISYTDYDNKTDEIAKVEICEFAKDNDIDVEFWKSGFDAWMPLPEPYREG